MAKRFIAKYVSKHPCPVCGKQQKPGEQLIYITAHAACIKAEEDEEQPDNAELRKPN